VVTNVMTKISIQNYSLKYSDGKESLRDISLDIPANQITVIFGPAGGGKSSLLRSLNRLNDLADVSEQQGKILIDNLNIMDPGLDVIQLRRRIGMVFARPVVLPFSIRENLTYGLEVGGEKNSSRLNQAVEIYV